MFSRKPLLDSNSAAWIEECFAWALRNLGSETFYNHTQLITPSSKHFPEKYEDASNVAATVFTRVREYAGMSGWECELVMQDPDPNTHVAPLVFIKDAPNQPAGTFSMSGEADNRKVKISYNPNLLDDPQSLIATMAHELAHYLGATIAEDPPGGDEYHEHATDVLAVFLGFGIFQLNSGFKYQAFSDVSTGTQGWSARRLGYLSPQESAYALAVFCATKDLDASKVQGYLSASKRGIFMRAMGDLAKRKLEIQSRLKGIH